MNNLLEFHKSEVLQTDISLVGTKVMLYSEIETGLVSAWFQDSQPAMAFNFPARFSTVRLIFSLGLTRRGFYTSHFLLNMRGF